MGKNTFPFVLAMIFFRYDAKSPGNKSKNKQLGLPQTRKQRKYSTK
jgi:hypothetical protein